MGFDGTSSGFGGGGGGGFGPAGEIEIDVTEITGGTSGYFLLVNPDGTLGQTNPATYTGFPISVDVTNILHGTDYSILFINPTTNTLGASASFGYIEASAGQFNAFASNTATAQASYQFSKARGTGAGQLLNGDRTGTVTWTGYDGVTFQSTAAIEGIVAGVVSMGSALPQALQFLTSSTNSASITTKMFIGPTGIVGIGWGGYTTNATGVLDVKAPGALSSDIAVRIRNSANSANLLNIAGNGDTFIGGNTGINIAPVSTASLFVYNHVASNTVIAATSDAADSITANFINSGTGANMALIVNSFNGTSNTAIAVSNGDITFNTGTGTMIGTTTAQKFAFWGATPVVQQANSVAIDTLLVTLGLRASGGSANFATNITMADATNFIVGSSTGTIFGTSATQKMAWWNATPVIQNTGWSTSNVSTTKALDANATSLDQLADIVGTMMNTMLSYGQFGA